MLQKNIKMRFDADNKELKRQISYDPFKYWKVCRAQKVWYYMWNTSDHKDTHLQYSKLAVQI